MGGEDLGLGGSMRDSAQNGELVAWLKIWEGIRGEGEGGKSICEPELIFCKGMGGGQNCALDLDPGA